MITDFSIVNAVTVPKTYSWDLGTPLQTTPTLTGAFTTQTYISGYAPGVKVKFRNQSISDANFPFITYEWDFGDLYHDTNNNVSLSCVSDIEHLYIMPGIYSVTLRHKQSRTRTILETNPLLCRGRYDVRWFWFEQESTVTLSPRTRVTWDETACVWLSATVPDKSRWKPKWWDDEAECFQKYCKAWSWYYLSDVPDRVNTNPIIWNDTGSDDVFEKKWMFEDNETQCVVKDFEYLDTLQVNEQFATKIGVVEVKELPPVADIICLTSPLTGIDSLSIRLSPSKCKPGSFPFERIDWDFGDGSPIKTITRYTNNNDPEIINTEAFVDDLLDVRNYDVLHTYVRTKNAYSVFYPSLTCYSANTSTLDSCCTTVGPISLPSLSGLQLIKVRNTLKGNLYAFNINKNVTFLSTTSSIPSITVLPNEPKSTLKNSSPESLLYFGYPGDDYPPEYTPSCDIGTDLPGNYLATEDDDPFTPDENDDITEQGIAIATEGDVVIIP